MSTFNLRPQNLLILAAVGIAAYWITTRQARAAGTVQGANRQFFTSPARAQLQPGAQPAAAGSTNAWDVLNSWVKGSTSSGTPQVWPSSTDDALAINPPNAYSSTFDPSAINGNY